MDQILELLRLVETLPAAWDRLLEATRTLVYGLLPAEVGAWLAGNEWLLWGVVAIVTLVLVTTLVGNIVSGE
ncbi:MAG: hypothetical protein AB7P40_18135 [Chloroflexota bacterium]